MRVYALASGFELPTHESVEAQSMLMRHVHPTLQFTHMLPYGAILHENGVQFVVYSRSATAMRLFGRIAPIAESLLHGASAAAVRRCTAGANDIAPLVGTR